VLVKPVPTPLFPLHSVFEGDEHAIVDDDHKSSGLVVYRKRPESDFMEIVLTGKNSFLQLKK
jgi:hypothetical protein